MYHFKPYLLYSRILVYSLEYVRNGTHDESYKQAQFRNHTESLVYEDRLQLFGNAVRLEDIETIRLCLGMPTHYGKDDWLIRAGSTALHLAVESRNTEAIELLFQHKVQANKVNLYGRSALGLALHDCGIDPAIALMVLQYAITREVETMGEDSISDVDYYWMVTNRVHNLLYHYREMVHDVLLSSDGYIMQCERSIMPQSN